MRSGGITRGSGHVPRRGGTWSAAGGGCRGAVGLAFARSAAGGGCRGGLGSILGAEAASAPPPRPPNGCGSR
eukprot:426116-Pyramimonas_sp.AAC.1